ncbi:mynd finger and set [Fusarium subglutinans]|uniref:Mynd finger and set n=1 Tax=Gibberella subglutinans TaxID=42677 RepID=A0A8H5Q9Z9_GIBSU|nr:mynd finger and set [Fusarium subglutinans]KAF5611427.1 mynd finger and set [Fusarium subglutinans]
MASNDTKLANLQDKKHFPGFEDLSWDNQLELDYYRQRENGFWEPRKHWVFIGEIVEVDIGFRVKLTVKDRDGLEIPIAIYTESRGLELGASNLQAGNTVVIFYAVKHLFMDMTIGIRHEDPEYLKIFPISLDNMMKLSDKIQTHATLTNGMRTCHGCNEKSSKLLKCAKCDFFWYCGHNCQLYGWKEKGHKEDCKILRDGNFKGLFSIKWDEFHNHLSFPLRSMEE